MAVCGSCIENRRICGGYQARLAWPSSGRPRRPPAGIQASHPQLNLPAFSSFGLPQAENRLLLHYAKNVTRANIAIDYEGNGFRRMVAISLDEPALLNGLLALSEAHLAKWEGKVDTRSKRYLSKSLQHLQGRLSLPARVKEELILITMLVLLLYELCYGNAETWKFHYNSMISLIQTQHQSSEVGAFYLSIVSMLAIQLLMQRGTSYMDKSYRVLQQISETQASHMELDVFHGCSVALPRLMVTAARLDDEVSRIRDSKSPADHSTLEDIHDRIRILQTRILETKIPPSHASISELRFGMLGNSALDAHNFKLAGQVYPGGTQFEAICTAEIFRLAVHIYVARIIYDPLTTGNSAPEIHAWVAEALELLPKVSDTIGPGIFLGWALVVIGSEVCNIDERNFIKLRLHSLELLAFNQGATAIRVLEEVWARKDSVRRGDAVGKKTRWQEVMLSMAVDITLM